MAASTPIGSLAVRVTADTASFIQKFERADKAVEKFSTKLDKRLLQPLAKVSAAAGAAAAGVLLFTNRITQTGDQLAMAAKRLGITTQAYSELRHAAEVSRVSVQTFDMAMQRFTRRAAEAASGTGEAKAALAELNIPLRDQAGRLRSSDELLGDVANAMQGVTSESDRVRLAFKLFDSEGVTMLNMLDRGSEGLARMRQEAHLLGRVWDNESAQAAADFQKNVVRLTGAVEGMQIKLAGPLVEGLNKAAEAMLKAQQRGDSLFSTLIEGWRTLLTGDDMHKWNVDFVRAVDHREKAQKKLDQAMKVMNAPGMYATGTRLRNQAIQELAAVNAEIERLQRIKPILAPFKSGSGEAATGSTGSGERLNEAQRGAREKHLEELAKIDKRMRDAAAEEAQIAMGVFMDSEAAGTEFLKEERERKLESLREHLAEDRRLRQEAVADEIALAREKADKEWQLQQETQRRQIEARKTFVENLAGLMNTSSKKAFEFGKKVSIAQAAVKGAQAVMDAWQAGMSTGGPWAPVVAAAYAAAAAVNAGNIINNIRSQEFGGGGGTPVAPSQGSSGVSPVGAGGAGGAPGGGGQTTIIKMPGEDLMSTKAVRGMLEKLNETMRDGGKIVFQ